MSRHPRLQEALDSVPIVERSAVHGRCALMDVLNQALEAQTELKGAAFAAVGVATGRHYVPCSSCARILQRFEMTAALPRDRSWVEPRPNSDEVVRLLSLVENIAFRRHSGDRRLRVAMALDLYRQLELTEQEAADLDIAEARWFRAERIAEFEEVRARVFAQNDLMIAGQSPDEVKYLRNALMLFVVAEPEGLDSEGGIELLGAAKELGIPLATLRAIAEKHLGDIDAIGRAETAEASGSVRMVLRELFSWLPGRLRAGSGPRRGRDT